MLTREKEDYIKITEPYLRQYETGNVFANTQSVSQLCISSFYQEGEVKQKLGTQQEYAVLSELIDELFEHCSKMLQEINQEK
ncbi:unnamed protein product [Paramecium octaurelia]|uniref:Uncharacterized protein n=1 Tax=Paramecium octaurelia TaxID=43137 RepID=A0A8S1SJJ9_PAROT|nr:unnamed protein product [Paramecium octaurelia]